MLKKLVIILLLVIALILLALWLGLGEDPGYLLLAWRNTTFETSLVAAAVAIVVLLLVLRLLLRMLHWLDPRPLLRRFRQPQDDGASRSRTTKGLLGFLSGDWERAYRELELSFNDPDATVANYLAAARAGHALGREELWTGCLDKAASRFPGALAVIREARAELLCDSDQPEKARALLEQLERTLPDSRHLLALQYRIYLRLQDWDRLDALSARLQDEGLLDEAQAAHLETQVFVGRLDRLAQTGGDGEAADPTAALLAFWDDAPHRYHKDPELVTRFVTLLVQAGAREEAAEAIEATLAATWHEPLVTIYGAEDLGECEVRLIHAEDWLRERPNDSTLLLALGRIAMRNRAWLSAREYFETCCRLQPGPEVYGELARLLVSLGDKDGGQEYLLKYLQVTDNNLPDLPLPEHRNRVAD